MQPEEELVRACASGDAAAWRRLVDLYSGWVLRVARAALRGSTEADVEDAAADVFRQLVERDRAMLRSLRPPYNLKAWLAIITRRASGKLRHLHRVVRNIEGVADRLLLELFFVHDCPYEEIASILGLSVESVGKQKTRALEKLRTHLE